MTNKDVRRMLIKAVALMGAAEEGAGPQYLVKAQDLIAEAQASLAPLVPTAVPGLLPMPQATQLELPVEVPDVFKAAFGD